MKYGKYLASRQLELPEYSGHFIDYKALKKLIKQLAIPTNNRSSGGSSSGNNNKVESASAFSNNTAAEIQKTLKENKATFFFRVERELDKVNSFYLEKQANLAINLNLLVLRRDELFAKLYRCLNQQHVSGNNEETLPLNSDIRNSISFLNLYQNFKKIHQDLIRLQQFIELNETGFSKVVKKWDKRSKSHTKELFISTAVSVQPVFHKNEINELSDLVTQSLFDIESIMDGDFTCLNNYSLHATSAEAQAQTLGEQSVVIAGEMQTVVDLQDQDQEQRQPAFVRQSSISNIERNNSEVDDLYASFVNVATIKDPDLSLLARWIDKINGSSKSANTPFSTSVKCKISKIFLLSITNLKISDSFLESFLELINYDIDLTLVNNDFNNNKTILHECCSISPTPTHHESHVVINNGVKVVNPYDSINHSRNFIVECIVKKLSKSEIESLLIRRDFNGRNCLHYAAQHNRGDLLDTIITLFPKEHIDDLGNDSMSPLLLAIKHGNLNIIKKLVQFGANPFPYTSKDTLQYLPINYACKFGDYKIIEYLLSNESSKELVKDLVNQQDVEGLLPLHVVSRAGHYKLIKLLIQYGAEINKFDGFNKWTPIFYAAAEGHVNTTQELVKFGARLDILDQDGYNVLYYCVFEGHIGVINELLSHHEQFFDKSKQPQSSQLQLIDNGEDTSRGILSSNSSSNSAGAGAGAGASAGADGAGDDAVNAADEEDDSEDSGSIDKNNIDSIPDLQLPPPILPLRRYGHNFLEQKVLIELIFPQDEFINLFNSATDLKPGRITLTSNISDIVPRNILLPLDEEGAGGNSQSNCVFQTDIDSLTEFRIDFEIFPKFGTRLIAKTTALSFSHFDRTSSEITSIELPLFDLRLRNIGQLKFTYQIIFPFSGTLLETSKFDTYWKSLTSFVKNKQTLKLNAAGGLSPNNFLSPNFNAGVNAVSHSAQNPAVQIQQQQQQEQLIPSSIVTATSLSGEYLRIKVCLLNDGTPVVCPHWAIAITENIDLYLPNLSLEQLTAITDDLFDYSKVIKDLSSMTVKDISLIKKLLRIIYLPLDIILEVLSPEINLNLELVFPSTYELEILPFVGNVQRNLNIFIDFTLNDVFNHMGPSKYKKEGHSTPSRSIIFLSSNALICKILNWKQPNFPVFLIMNGITYNRKLNKFEKKSTNGLLIESSSNNNSSSSSGDKGGASNKEISKASNLKNYQELIIRSIKEAVNFSINNNLFGLITSIHLLDLVPKLISLIRSRGLILVASSDVSERGDEMEEEILKKELDSYIKTEINGLRFDDVLSFKEDITM
ncbi:PHO81 [Candida oxycetoniae]|uniref:PHO81 n=1 Tax=Candida oxycetoniae TaxID=497107 RepID=A0AAI9SWM8_9ASCO|nr:PHO81 [Candida oxycetoniae]KAI3404105.2 PHO81 [Candida oxycetoniae]